MIFSYCKHYFIVFNVNNTWPFYLLNWQGVGSMWVISVSFVHTGLLVWAFLKPHKLNLTYCLKSSMLLAFCFMFVCIVDQTQIYPSSISPLGLFQSIICNIERLREGALEPWITGETWFERRNLRPMEQCPSVMV